MFEKIIENLKFGSCKIKTDNDTSLSDEDDKKKSDGVKK